MGTVPPFNSPLGLRTVGIDYLDTQGSHCAAEVGYSPALSVENGSTVNIEATGESVALRVGPEGPHAVGSVLTGGKAQEDPVGGVVDHVEQRACRTPSLEPVMIRAVKLDQLANGRSARSL